MAGSPPPPPHPAEADEMEYTWNKLNYVQNLIHFTYLCLNFIPRLAWKKERSPFKFNVPSAGRRRVMSCLRAFSPMIMYKNVTEFFLLILPDGAVLCDILNWPRHHPIYCWAAVERSLHAPSKCHAEWNEHTIVFNYPMKFLLFVKVARNFSSNFHSKSLNCWIFY